MSHLYSKQYGRLFENQLGEAVEAVLPDDEVMTLARIVDEGAGDALLVAEGLELGAVVHQADRKSVV